MGALRPDPRLHRLWPYLALTLLVGCTGNLRVGGSDGGRARDAGTLDAAIRDAEPPGLDAGPVGMDAGPPFGVDAGPPFGVDAGPPRSDAGAPPGLPAHCTMGPLDLPIPDCRPAPLPSTGDPAEDCVRRVNQLRAECQCLGPLERWRDGEACADMQAEYDGMGAGAHGGFRAGICSPSGRAQNECPGYSSMGQVIGTCLQQMWDEGPGEPFSAHGHYINMTNPAHSRVACGFYTTPSGRVWAVQNF